MEVYETVGQLKQARRALMVHEKALKAALRRTQAGIRALDTLLADQTAGAQRHRSSAMLPKRHRRSTVRPVVLAVLEGTPSAMHTDDILAELQQRQTPMRARKPRDTVASALRRLAEDGSIERVGRNLFRMPAAGRRQTEEPANTELFRAAG